MKLTLKKGIAIGLAVLVLAGLFLFLRSPNVSNYLKKTIFTEIEAATGYQLMAERVIVNLFPFYVEARGVKVLDEKGQRTLTTRSVKVYVSLSRLLSKTLYIKRVVLVSPEAVITPERVERISSLGKGKKKKPGAFQVKVKTIEVRDGGVDFLLASGESSIIARGMGAEAELGEKNEFRLWADDVLLHLKSIPEIRGSLKKSTAMLEKGVLHIKKAGAEVDGSEMDITDGSYSKKEGILVSGNAKLLLATFKKLFHVDAPGEGRVTVKGDIRLADFKNLKSASFKAAVKGQFQLEPFLQLVRAGVDIKGLARVNGRMQGTVGGFTANGEGRVTNGNIYGFLVDQVSMRVNWQDGLLTLADLRGTAYDGKTSGAVYIPLPKPKTYTVKVDVEGASSQKLLPALGINFPIAPGSVDGGFVTSGPHFRPEGSFAYRSTVQGKDLPGRLRTITGQFALGEGKILRISNAVARTDSTEIRAADSLDLKEKKFDLIFTMVTNRLEDLTVPYYTAVSGKGAARGTIKGPFKDPTITASVAMLDVKHGEYRMGSVAGTFTYNKNLLSITALRGKVDDEDISANGKISFPAAGSLFQFKNPVYDLRVKLSGADIAGLARLAKSNAPLKGKISGDFNLRGTAPLITGHAVANDIAYGQYSASRAEVDFSYEKGLLKVADARLQKGKSVLNLTGTINKSKEFAFRTSSGLLKLSDAFPGKLPLDYTVTVTAAGKGTFARPEVKASGTLIEGLYKTQKLPKGDYTAELFPNRVLQLQLTLAKRLNVQGAMTLAGNRPWQARVDIKSGRYDYLLGAFLKTRPEDLLVNLAGHGAFSGTKDNLNGELTLSQLTVAGFGQSFTAARDARILIKNKDLAFHNFSLSGGQGMINLSGSMVLGKSYDLDIEGKSSLAPAKAFIKELDILTGNASLVFHVGGLWRKPRLSGGLTVTDGAIGVKGLPQNIRIISSYLYIDEDRLTLEEFNARMGGGNLSVTGVLYLEGVRPRRYYFDTLLSNVNVTLKEVTATVSGNMVLRREASGQSLFGEVNLQKAIYRNPVDWRAVVLGKKSPPRAQKGFLAETDLRLRVYGSNDIEIRNNLARAPLSLDLTIRGTLANPIPVGRVQATKGRLYFRNTEFEVEQASVIFADPTRINPVLNILATTTTQGYRIRVSISGTLDRFNLALTSDPTLDEMSILSLLTVGELGAGKGAGGGIGAAEATSFVAGQLQGVVSERLRSITGVDRFQVDPYVSKTTGTITPRVIVGKRLLGDKLSVIYAAPVGAQEEDVIRLEYAVSDKVSFIGERDETGDTGVDVRFRFQFK
jgi:autotransporter translocation and assembly factor TamB